MTEPASATAGAAAEVLTIDVISDVMCPWCYIGKRRLQAAVAALGDAIPLDIRWRPYQLDPTLPKEGKDRRQYLEEKFGGAEGARQAYENVRNAGRDVEIPFDFDAIAVSANTLDAHRLIRWAGSQGTDVQARMVEILFRAYFVEGKNIGDDAVLIDAAREGGLDPHIVRTLLEQGADKDKVEEEIAMARRMGVTGVPCFILGEKYALIGAQPSETIEQAIRQVASERAGAENPGLG